MKKFFFGRKFLLNSFLIITVSIFFSWLQWGYSFVDPDAWYHARLSALLWQQGPKINFTWLPFTQLNFFYTDHHFLYHLFVAPFIVGLEPWLALKVATVVLSLVFICLFYWFLKKHQVSYPLVFIWLLLASQPFLFRLSLAKALPLVLSIVLLAVHFVWQRRAGWIFILSFLMVWSYAGWPLLQALLVSYALFSFFLGRRLPERDYLPLFFVKDVGCLILAGSSGTLLGLVLHPYFPANLKFYWQQFWQIGVVNLQGVIGVGGEWYPYRPELLLANLGLLVFFIILAFYLIAIKKFRLSVQSWWLFFWSIVFLVFTLRSQRYVEYLVPFLVMFAAIALRDVGFSSWLKRRYIQASRLAGWRKIGYWLLMVYFLFSFAFLTGRDINTAQRQIKSGKKIDIFQPAAEFLAKYTPSGAVVFHSDWDEFPLLWYWNQRNRYVAGLDPTFFYQQDSKRYTTWVDITAGRIVQDSTEEIKKNFSSKWIFIDQGHDIMKLNLLKTGRWRKVFSDKEVTILKLKEDNE